MNELMILSAVLQGMALLLPLIAVFPALRLGRLTGWTIPGLVIPGGLFIMARRWAYVLRGWGAADDPRPGPGAGITGPAFYLLILSGLTNITPLFQTSKDAWKNPPLTGRALPSLVATYPVPAGRQRSNP